MTISFKVSDAEADLIVKIVDRAHKEIFEPRKFDTSRLNTTMDLSACIANGCPLRLQELLDADKSNFSHDICGIYRHIDRNTGKLLDCFVPRFARGGQA